MREPAALAHRRTGAIVPPEPLFPRFIGMRLTFLRHAESAFNADEANHTLDCSLSDAGFAQAAQLQGHWTLALVSPMLRTQLTLICSQITCDQVQLYSGVREQRTDPCDFLPDEDPSQLESDARLMDRADDFLREVVSLYAGVHAEILIVSHCEFIHACTAQSPHNAQFVVLELKQPKTIAASGSAPASAASSNAAPTSAASAEQA